MPNLEDNRKMGINADLFRFECYFEGNSKRVRFFDNGVLTKNIDSHTLITLLNSKYRDNDKCGREELIRRIMDVVIPEHAKKSFAFLKKPLYHKCDTRMDYVVVLKHILEENSND